VVHVAEDARAAARRIVEEVLAAHGQAATTEDAFIAVTAPADPEVPVGDRPDEDPFATVDPRMDAAAGTGLPDALADRPSRAVARRIVEEVLAAHAAAERDVELPAPAAEADGPPPLPEAVPVQPVPGRDAVVPGAPASEVAVELPTEPEPGAIADDAASIARRIVADVLADAEARAEAARTADHEVGGPPAIPADDPEATQALLAAETPDEEPAAEDDAEATVALPAVDEPTPSAEPVPTAADTPADDAPVRGTSSDDTPDDVAEETPDLRPADADTTVPLAPDHPDASARPASPPLERRVDGGVEDEGAVATLPPRTDASAEVTTPVPVTEPQSRRTHWLLASILGAVGLAVLLPLAVAALRSLVELS
jgi:hypothetical protein